MNIRPSSLHVEVDAPENPAIVVNDFPILLYHALDAAVNRYRAPRLQMIGLVSSGTSVTALLDRDWDGPIVNDSDQNDVLPWIDRTRCKTERDRR
jgi:hypothetical protein